LGVTCTADSIKVEESPTTGGFVIREYRIIGACNGVDRDRKHYSFYIDGELEYNGWTKRTREVFQAFGPISALVWTQSSCLQQDPFMQSGGRAEIWASRSGESAGYDLSGTPVPPGFQETITGQAPLLAGFTTPGEVQAVKQAQQSGSAISLERLGASSASCRPSTSTTWA
jgi:hypothetical protein